MWRFWILHHVEFLDSSPCGVSGFIKCDCFSPGSAMYEGSALVSVMLVELKYMNW